MQEKAIPTKLFGSAGEGSLHSPAMRIIPAADAALIFNLIGANFLVTTHFLQKEEEKTQKIKEGFVTGFVSFSYGGKPSQN